MRSTERSNDSACKLGSVFVWSVVSRRAVALQGNPYETVQHKIQNSHVLMAVSIYPQAITSVKVRKSAKVFLGLVRCECEIA
jgi:hypothetical protein